MSNNVYIELHAVDRTEDGINQAEKNLNARFKPRAIPIYAYTNAEDVRKHVEKQMKAVKGLDANATMRIKLQDGMSGKMANLVRQLSSMPAAMQVTASFDGGGIIEQLRALQAQGKGAADAMKLLEEARQKASVSKEKGDKGEKYASELYNAASRSLNFDKQFKAYDKQLTTLSERASNMSKKQRESFFSSKEWQDANNLRNQMFYANYFGGAADVRGMKDASSAMMKRLYESAAAKGRDSKLEAKYNVGSLAELQRKEKEYAKYAREYNKAYRESLVNQGGKIGDIPSLVNRVNKAKESLTELKSKMDALNQKHNNNLGKGLRLYDVSSLDVVIAKMQQIKSMMSSMEKNYGKDAGKAINAPLQKLYNRYSSAVKNGPESISSISKLSGIQAAEREAKSIAQGYMKLVDENNVDKVMSAAKHAARSASEYIKDLENIIHNKGKSPARDIGLNSIRADLEALNKAMRETNLSKIKEAMSLLSSTRSEVVGYIKREGWDEQAENKKKQAIEQAENKKKQAIEKSRREEENRHKAISSNIDRELKGIQRRREDLEKLPDRVGVSRIAQKIATYENHLRNLQSSQKSDATRKEIGVSNILNKIQGLQRQADVLRELDTLVQRYAKSLKELNGMTTSSAVASKLQKSLKDGLAADIRTLRQEIKGGTAESRFRVLQAAKFRMSDYSSQVEGLRRHWEVVRQTQREYANLFDKLNAKTRQHNGIISQLGQEIAAAYSVYQLQNFLSKLVDIGGQFEYQRRAIANILGDTEKANTLFNQIKGLALKSPFSTLELDSYAKQLSAFDVPYSEMFDKLKKLADIAAGTGADMSRIILAYGHVKAEGFLTGVQRRQFSNANINVVGALADMYSKQEGGRLVTKREVYDRISKKEVSSEDLDKVLMAMAEPGGKFYKMQEAMAGTTKAMWKNVGDAMNHMYMDMEEKNRGELQAVAELMMNILKITKDVVPSFGQLVVMIGAARSAMWLFNNATNIGLGKEARAALKANNETIRQMEISARRMQRYGVGYNPISRQDGLWMAAREGKIGREQLASLAYHGKADFSTVQKSGLFSVKELQGIQAMNEGVGKLGFAWRKAKSAVMAFGASLKAAFASMLPMLAITAVFEGIFYFINKSRKEEEAMNEQTKNLENSIRRLGETINYLNELDLEHATAEQKKQILKDMLQTLKDEDKLLGEMYQKKLFDTDGQLAVNIVDAINQIDSAIRKLHQSREDMEAAGALKVAMKVYTDDSIFTSSFDDKADSVAKTFESISDSLSTNAGLMTTFRQEIQKLVAANPELKEGLKGVFENGAILNLRGILEVIASHPEFFTTFNKAVKDRDYRYDEKGNATITAFGSIRSMFVDLSDKYADARKKEVKADNEAHKALSANSEVLAKDNERRDDAVELSKKTSILSQENNGHIKQNTWLIYENIKATDKLFESKRNLLALRPTLPEPNIYTSELAKQAHDFFKSKSLKRLAGPDMRAEEFIAKARARYKENKSRIKDLKGLKGETDHSDYQRAVDENKELLEASRRFNFSLENEGKGNEGKGNGGRKDDSDKGLKQWQKTARSIEEVVQAFRKLKDAKKDIWQSDNDILSEMKKMKEYNDVIKELANKGIKVSDLVTQEGLSKVWKDFLAKDIPFTGGKRDVEGRTSAKAKVRGDIVDLDISINKDRIEKEAKHAKDLLERLMKRMEVYVEVKKLTTSPTLAKQVSQLPIFADNDATREMKRQFQGLLATAGSEKAVNAQLAKFYEVEAKSYAKQLKAARENGDVAKEEDLMTNFSPKKRSISDILDFKLSKDEVAKIFGDNHRITEWYNGIYDAMLKAGDEIRHSIVEAIKEVRSTSTEKTALIAERDKALAYLSSKASQSDVEGFASIDNLAKAGISDRVLQEAVATASKNKTSEELKDIVNRHYDKKLRELNAKLFLESNDAKNSFREIVGQTSKSIDDVRKAATELLNLINASREDVRDEKTGELLGYNFKGEKGESRFVKQSDYERLVKAKEDSSKNSGNFFVRMGANEFGKAFQSVKAWSSGEKIDGKTINFTDALQGFSTITKFAGDATKSISTMFASFEDTEGVQDALAYTTAGLESASSIAMGIASGNPIQILTGITGLVTNLAQIHDQQLNRAIENSRLKLQYLQSAYQDLQEELEHGFGFQEVNATEMMENLKAQKAEIEKQMKLEKDKKKSDKKAIQDYEQQINESNKRIARFAEERMKQTIGVDFKGWARQLGDALFDAFDRGEDAALKWEQTVGDIVRNMTKNMLVAGLVEPLFGKLKAKVFGVHDKEGNMLKQGLLKEDASNMLEVSDVIKRDLKPLYNQTIQAAFGNIVGNVQSMFPASSSQQNSGTLGRLTSATTEQTSSLMASYLNSIRSDVSKQNVIAQQQLQSMNQIIMQTKRTADMIESVIDGRKQFHVK